MTGEIISRIYCAVKWENPSYVYRYSLDRDVFYELNPGWEGDFGGVPIRINSLGLRDRDYLVKKDEKTYRIIVLGDSMTFGWKLNLEDTFEKLLERKLNEEVGSGSYEVINAAVPGYNLRQEVASLNSNWLRFKPDMVILGVFINDITDFNAKPIRVLPQMPIGSFPLKLSDVPRKSFFFQFLALKWDLIREKYNRDFNVPPVVENTDFLKGVVSANTRQYWLEADKQLKELARLAEKDSFEVLIFYWPDINQFHKGEDYRGLQRILAEEADKYNFYFVDLSSALENSKEWPLLSEKFSGDYHPNEIGHKVAADVLFECLNLNKILSL